MRISDWSSDVCSSDLDIGDYGCAVFDADSRLLAQTPDSTPGLCGPLGSMLRYLLEAHPPATLADGDVIIGNDPWAGSGHHNDEIGRASCRERVGQYG